MMRFALENENGEMIGRIEASTVALAQRGLPAGRRLRSWVPEDEARYAALRAAATRRIEQRIGIAFGPPPGKGKAK